MTKKQRPLPIVNPYSLEKINSTWQAVHKATLIFVLKDDQVLLIRKKRGLGAGKINGPGGKAEGDESLQQCAHRELKEELCISVNDSNHRGRLRFQFTDGYSLDVHVFVATQYEGVPTETEEAIPLWYSLDKIPFDEMWEDDKIWLPRVLSGEKVNGRFVFDGDNMQEHEVLFSAS